MAKKGKPSKTSTPPPTAATEKNGNGKSKKKDLASNNETSDSKDDPKKPQRGLVIGENFGWTGKLPATLLYEFCQKAKWAKPEFEMRKAGSSGFKCVVILSWENPKDKKLIKLKYIPTYDHCKTTNEARHMAATYTLYRINFIKNMKMLLPIIFRDYWTQLDQDRSIMLKENKTKHDLIYNVNPFVAHLEQVALNEKKEKERLIKEQNELKVKKASINITTVSSINNDKKKSDKSVKNQLLPKSNPIMNPSTIVTFPKKVWDNAPFIDFASDIRGMIESCIKKHINWILDTSPLIPSRQVEKDTQTLLNLGFRKQHIEESIKYTSTFTDSLEWLLFHIPEDDLPAFFSKTDKDSQVQLKLSKDLQLEYKLKRILQSGFDEDEVLSTLEVNEGDELATCIKLTQSIVPSLPKPDIVSDFNTEDSLLLWEQELDGITMVESNKVEYFSNQSKDIVTITLNPIGLKISKDKQSLLSVKLFKSMYYPHELPGIQIIVNDSSFKLANYIKLSILNQLIHDIINKNWLGDCLIFNIIEWLEQNISRIIDNPGPLIDEYEYELADNTNSESSIATESSNLKKHNRKVSSNRRAVLSEKDLSAIEANHLKKQDTNDLKKSWEQRSQLPAWKSKEELISMINSNKVTIVTGETGSGKSTQIVQFILDDLNSKGNFKAKILCTQPRRISTIGLAERISDERLDKVGRETGYIIRGENKTDKLTRISFVTTGVLLRMLQSFLGQGSSSNSVFDNLDYIFIDEVHERSVDSDFLLIILKRVMNKFPNLKIILMSATVNIETFNNFFGFKLNHIHIKGRTFPIKDYYLEEILEDLDFSITSYDGDIIKPKADSHFFKTGNINYNLIAQLCLKIDKKLMDEKNDGSILIFLPGILEISHCIQNLRQIFDENNSKGRFFPLHSALSSQDQKSVFKFVPKGTRKIVVSTNVAETSITIPDCVVVIDCGRSKSVFFDAQLNTTKLVENWCSKAEINQRRGRSGRITNGNCYHLYTKEVEQTLLSQPIPEIKRTRLENLYLIVKAMGINNVEDFLNGGIDAPEQSSLIKSKKFLHDIGALDNTDNLSNLGKYLSLLPTDLQSGKLLILGCIFGCLDFCLTLASLSSTGSPFLDNRDERDKIKKIRNNFSNNNGDFIAQANAYHEFEKLRKSRQNTRSFISSNYLSYNTLNDISSTRSQYISFLKDMGFIPIDYESNQDLSKKSYLNRNSNNFSIIRSIITGSYYPQIARVQLPDPKFFKSSVGSVAIDPEAKQTKFWIRNEAFIEKIDQNQSVGELLPATRSLLFSNSVVFDNYSPDNEASQRLLQEVIDEEGNIDSNKYRELIDLTPKAPKSSNQVLKSSFIVYGRSQKTTSMYIGDITPSGTLSILLFGGDIDYNLGYHIEKGRTSPGIVMDNWLPIRTWCKNAVLMKRLRKLMDAIIEDKLSNPHYTTSAYTNSNDDILSMIETLVST
ncbi:P-loop containing nucleoside triphosphate hydrolase protein [Scheffersomyces amazonensis]|uniref:P-loop containing nucleoside triphosphate hydrolase protein n=1 Tax=Scheffersomyces amazonensis TaxID=1078765 RepID=UPI00315D900D